MQQRRHVAEQQSLVPAVAVAAHLFDRGRREGAPLQPFLDHPFTGEIGRRVRRVLEQHGPVGVGQGQVARVVARELRQQIEGLTKDDAPGAEQQVHVVRDRFAGRHVRE